MSGPLIHVIGLLTVGVSLSLSACGGSNTTATTSSTIGGGSSTGLSEGAMAWVGGANVVSQKSGVYGTQGVAATDNIPSARNGAVSWTDASRNFWLFGGYGNDSTGAAIGPFNDLWKYSAGQWTWVGGSNDVDQKGAYGTQGVAAAGNIPGARSSAASWIDAAGNFWLFGGFGHDSITGTIGYLNDLWKYGAGQWTWVGGSNVTDQQGTYGTQGMAAASNTPSARSSAITWTDAAGNFWLFGGVSSYAGSVISGASAAYNDLWKYSAGQWTWVGGSNTINQQGTYGTQGTAAAANIPGARYGAARWTDAAGNFWLFGGFGYDSAGVMLGVLNDLWKYSAGQWTWVGGSNAINQQGTYGTQGTAAAANIPRARYSAASWTDAAGNFWLFGGYGEETTLTPAYFNDMWKYSAGQWTWIGGSNIIDLNGNYGTQGVAARGNIPGARYSAVSWTDAASNVWLFGGDGFDSAGRFGYLNDLWKYGP